MLISARRMSSGIVISAVRREGEGEAGGTKSNTEAPESSWNVLVCASSHWHV